MGFSLACDSVRRSLDGMNDDARRENSSKVCPHDIDDDRIGRRHDRPWPDAKLADRHAGVIMHSVDLLDDLHGTHSDYSDATAR